MTSRTATSLLRACSALSLAALLGACAAHSAGPDSAPGHHVPSADVAAPSVPEQVLAPETSAPEPSSPEASVSAEVHDSASSAQAVVEPAPVDTASPKSSARKWWAPKSRVPAGYNPAGILEKPNLPQMDVDTATWHGSEVWSDTIYSGLSWPLLRKALVPGEKVDLVATVWPVFTAVGEVKDSSAQMVSGWASALSLSKGAIRCTEGEDRLRIRTEIFAYYNQAVVRSEFEFAEPEHCDVSTLGRDVLSRYSRDVTRSLFRLSIQGARSYWKR